MSLCGPKSLYVIQSSFPLPTGRDSVRYGWRESRKGTYYAEVKGVYDLWTNRLRRYYVLRNF